MAQSDQGTTLTEQYLQLTRDTPRKMCATDAETSNDMTQTAREAEWSLRRIEGRVGSIT
ncbi:hypothetical protein [Roseovarius sp. MMSF_3281]|uniref:hypothetical protein n=1 Tax=Roseovarius sp. MMSF_3281 TaxID=3046694 RepID=UPI00273F6162|nr:hypothetical protein [Roseovarius sp. MMSF_3281]